MENMELSNNLNIDENVLIERSENWSKFGVMLYKSELKLQAIAQNSILDLKIPENVSELEQSEQKIKELKKVQKILEEERKKITSVFDKKTQDLMFSEKSLTPHIEKLSNAIISIKKQEDEKRLIAEKRDKEIKIIRQKINDYFTNLETQYLNKITLSVNKSYENALINLDIKPSDIKQYLIDLKSKVNSSHFPIKSDISIQSELINKNDIESLVTEIQSNYKNSDYFLNNYIESLHDKFDFYEIAYNDKQTALEKSKEEEAKKIEVLEKEKLNKTIANNLQAASTNNAKIESNYKPLKKSYEVDLEENMENSMNIISAFVANYDLCIKKIRITKSFNLSVGHMAKALGDLKSEDNLLEITNIKFREIQKL